MQTNSRKLLIVKPPYSHIPLGMAYVLSCLERNNIPFDFIDTLFTKPDYNKLIKNNSYLAFATGGLIANFDLISKTVKTIRSIKPNLPIILGGNITKDVNPEILFDKEFLGIDYGVIGEAETALPYLIDKLNKGAHDFVDVPGLLYKDKTSGEIIINKSVRLDLESVNMLPAWHHINIDYYKYSQVSYMSNQMVLPVLTGRGCVGTCTFCSPTVGKFRKRPVEHVMEEIEFLFSKYNFDILNILNEMFYQTKEDILRFCAEYKKLKIKKPWMCGMRVDVKDIDNDTFTAMKEAGCILAGMGIESGSNKVLEIMKKRITKDQVISFCRSAKKAKLPCFGTFMIGNEGENEEDVKETIDMVINEEMNTDASLLDAYPGTQIYKDALLKGLIKNEKEYYRNVHFTPNPYDLSWENREDYLNISSISNDRFWRVIFSELRRFYTFSYNRSKVLNAKYKLDRALGRISATGLCSECGSPVKIFTNYNLLGQLTYCPKCYATLYLDYYKLKDFTEHYDMLRRELNGVDKLVIVGVGQQAMNILRYDHFGLKYEQMKGFLDPDYDQNPRPLFTFLPRLKMADLSSIAPDVILIADDPAGDMELRLKVYYSKEQLKASLILHLIPDKKRLSLKITRYILNFTTGKGNKAIIDRAIWGLIIKILALWDLLAIVTYLSMRELKQILRRVFGAAFVGKLQRIYLRHVTR